MQDPLFNLHVQCTILALFLLIVALGIPRTEWYHRWAEQRKAAPRWAVLRRNWEMLFPLSLFALTLALWSVNLYQRWAAQRRVERQVEMYAAAKARLAAARVPSPAAIAEARARVLGMQQRAAERAQALDHKAVAAKVKAVCGVEPTLIIPAWHVAGLAGTAQVDAVYLGGLNASLALFDQASVKCAVCAEEPAANNDPANFDPGSWILVERRLPVEPKSVGNCKPRSVHDLYDDVAFLIGAEKLAHRRRSFFEKTEPARRGMDPSSPDTTLIYPDMAPPDSGQPPRDPACDNVRLMNKAGTTGQKLRVCAHDDPDPTCLHEAAPPGPVPTGAPTEPEPGAGEGGMRIRRQGRPRIPPHGQKPPVWPPPCPVCGAPGPDGRPIPSAFVPSPRPHARPHDSEETPQRANELEALAYAELLKDPFFKGDDPYDDIAEADERACKAARYPYEAARLPDVRHGLDEFKACRAVAAALLQSARSAQALRSVPTAYAYVAHRLDASAPRALAAFREACRYHDAPSCVSYALLRSSGFPTSAPTPKDREAGRSALVRGCKLAQMQAGVILSACTGEARPVPGKEVCEPEVEHLDDPRPRIGACLDGSKAPPPPPAPSPR